MATKTKTKTKTKAKVLPGRSYPVTERFQSKLYPKGTVMRAQMIDDEGDDHTLFYIHERIERGTSDDEMMFFGWLQRVIEGRRIYGQLEEPDEMGLHFTSIKEDVSVYVVGWDDDNEYLMITVDGEDRSKLFGKTP